MLAWILGEVVLRQVGTVTAVQPPVPDHEADAGDQQEQSQPDREWIDVECVPWEYAEPRFEHRRRHADRALVERRHYRHLLARPQCACRAVRDRRGSLLIGAALLGSGLTLIAGRLLEGIGRDVQG